MEFVLVPGGKFQMGSPEDEKGRWDNEGPQHWVTIKPFLMGKYPVTQKVWKDVMGNEPWSGKSYVKEGDDYPAVYISWNDCKEFCKKTGLQLPSEAQWEYACRAGTTTRFYWGDDLDYMEIGKYAWYDENAWDVGEKYAHKVGQKLPNAFGLYDMSGNVWEWCEDSWHNSYKGAPADGTAWTIGSSSDRVNRGGSWNSYGRYCRSAGRDGNSPGVRLFDLGVRFVAPLGR